MKLIKKHPLISTSIILFLCCEFYVLILEKFKFPILSYIKNVLNSPYTILIFLIGIPIIYFSFKAVFISYLILTDFMLNTLVYNNKYYKILKEKEKYWVDRASKSYHYIGRGENIINYKRNKSKK